MGNGRKRGKHRGETAETPEEIVETLEEKHGKTPWETVGNG